MPAMSAPFTQCSIATSVLNVGDCCNGAACDVWRELTLPLQTVGHYVDPPLDCSQSTVGVFEKICNEVDLGRPIGARIQWSDGNYAHFVVICGYSLGEDGSETLYVLDPWCNNFPCDGNPIRFYCSFSEFFGCYQGHGKCTTLYLTQ